MVENSELQAPYSSDYEYRPQLFYYLDPYGRIGLFEATAQRRQPIKRSATQVKRERIVMDAMGGDYRKL